MNVTFLIGNGFDIGVGLKSSFQDFFPIYQELSQKKPHRIKQLASEIEADYKTWADFEKALGQYTVNFSSENRQDLIDQIRDFESEFIKYLKYEEHRIFGEKNDALMRIDMFRVMTEGLLLFYSLKNLAKESNAVVLEIINKYQKETIHFNFLNFNYTHVLENLLNIVSEHEKNIETKKPNLYAIDSVIHVHGDYDAHPIIGLNDASQIANKELSQDPRFVRYLLKPQINQSLRTGNDRMATEIINKSNIICIYGMSIGETDKKWWDILMKWLHLDTERQLIIFDYDKDYQTDTPYGWLEKEDYYIDKFNDFSSSSFDVSNMRSRIHIAINKNIFSMTHITTASPKQNFMTLEEYLNEKKRRENKSSEESRFATDEEIDALFNDSSASEEKSVYEEWVGSW